MGSTTHGLLGIFYDFQPCSLWRHKRARWFLGRETERTQHSFLLRKRHWRIRPLKMGWKQQWCDLGPLSLIRIVMCVYCSFSRLTLLTQCRLMSPVMFSIFFHFFLFTISLDFLPAAVKKFNKCNVKIETRLCPFFLYYLWKMAYTWGSKESKTSYG